MSNNKWKQIQNMCTFGGLPCRNSAFSGHQLDPLQLRDCQRDGRVSSLSGLSWWTPCKFVADPARSHRLRRLLTLSDSYPWWPQIAHKLPGSWQVAPCRPPNSHGYTMGIQWVYTGYTVGIQWLHYLPMKHGKGHGQGPWISQTVDRWSLWSHNTEVFAPTTTMVRYWTWRRILKKSGFPNSNKNIMSYHVRAAKLGRTCCKLWLQFIAPKPPYFTYLDWHSSH